MEMFLQEEQIILYYQQRILIYIEQVMSLKITAALITKITKINNIILENNNLQTKNFTLMINIHTIHNNNN